MTQAALGSLEGLLERARRASLVFDSFRQPGVGGLRVAPPSPRQLLYRAGRYRIMLRVEPGADADHLSLVGQVLDEVLPKKPLVDVPVLAFRRRETVDRTLTNHLGEFHLEPVPAKSLRLFVGVPGNGPVIVTLPPAG